MSERKIFHTLVINPGSTSTKLGWFENEIPGPSTTIRHDAGRLASFSSVWDQFAFRLEAVQDWLRSSEPRPDAIAAIGGLFRPIRGGTYRVNERMLADARRNLQGEHASNLGCAMADALARQYNCQAFVVDPVSVDEFEPLARYSGSNLIERRSLSHALNIHAVARRVSQDLRPEYCGYAVCRSPFRRRDIDCSGSRRPHCGCQRCCQRRPILPREDRWATPPVFYHPCHVGSGTTKMNSASL